MTFKNSKQRELDITFRPDYKKALFGLFHVAFEENDGCYHLPLEEKESLEEALYFYENRILKRKEYPVFEDDQFVFYPSQDKKVLFQVLGLPEEVFQKLDTEKEILPQLCFKENLFQLKRECCAIDAKSMGRKWFADDFKLYCLKNGFFFLYDETKPFIKEETTLPVFIDERKLMPKYKRLYEQSRHDRLAIDFLGAEDDFSFNEKMKEFDCYSLDERLSFFVNGDENLPIQVDEEFKRKYSLLLRKYLSSLINALYDDYALEVLNKTLDKFSYLSLSLARTNRVLYSISSFNADMYSIDRKNFFFSLEDKKKISDLIKKEYHHYQEGDLLSFYSAMKLPFEGYSFLKDKKGLTEEEILSSLPFMEVSSTEIYLSGKRLDSFYSYASGTLLHERAFLLRLLRDQGIEYSQENIEDSSLALTIEIHDGIRWNSLRKLFDEKGRCSLLDIFSSYQGLCRKDQIDLSKKIKRIDDVSCLEACSSFYHLFTNRTLSEAVETLLRKYDLLSLLGENLKKFFSYVLLYPLLIAKQEYRMQALANKDTSALLVLDGISSHMESYEANLPLPYVTFSQAAYSFRKDSFSKASICSCQKQALRRRYAYYRSYVHKRFENGKDLDSYVLSRIGLPENILSQIDFDADDFFSQIPFEKHVCHLCNHMIPINHEKLTDNEEDLQNALLTYIRARSSLYGVHFSTLLKGDEIKDSFLKAVDDRSYHSVLDVSEKYVDPVLQPYLHFSAKSAVSFLAAFYPEEIGYDDFYYELNAFYELGDSMIQKILFECTLREYLPLLRNLGIVYDIYEVYKKIEIAYAMHVSSDIILTKECEFCMNMDYNPKLKYPYVLFGSCVNAYMSDPNDTHFYLCECEKENLIRFAKKYDELYKKRGLNKEIKTPLILGLLGLPYRVIQKYQDYDLENNSVDSLIENMEFVPSICRRCLNENHSAYDGPFKKTFPFKKDLHAEYDFAQNGMFHDGFKVLSSLSLREIRYDPDHLYDLDGYADDLLPVFECCTDAIPEKLFTYFSMDQEKLKNILSDFKEINLSEIEANAYMSSLLLDTSMKNSNVFLDFIFEDLNTTLEEKIKDCFPEIKRVRKEFTMKVEQQILGFITYLIELLLKRYAIKESRIGR